MFRSINKLTYTVIESDLVSQREINLYKQFLNKVLWKMLMIAKKLRDSFLGGETRLRKCTIMLDTNTWNNAYFRCSHKCF